MKKLLIFAIAVLGLLACTGKNDPKDPSNNSATISCDIDTIVVSESGGKFTVTVSSKAEWSATANNSWVSISPYSGQGDAFVTINVAAGKKDKAHVLFSNGESSATLVVYRENISCDPIVKEVSSYGEEFSVTIESHSSWSASSNMPWVTVFPNSGYGDTEVHIKVARNNQKEACVTFSSPTSSATLTIRCEEQHEGGLLPGKFSVHHFKQVQFSQGNLQYQASTQTWWFAVHQYDTIGIANSNISDTYDGLIDLFGWGTGSNPTLSSMGNNDYSTFVDWGINAISNGGNEANLWRTLTGDELSYLLRYRANAAILFGLGNVNGVSGLIILPDNWSNPQDASFTPSSTNGLVNDGDGYYDSNVNHFNDNCYTAKQWLIMESAGAVFLPTAGERVGTNEIRCVGTYGSYYATNRYHDVLMLDFSSSWVGISGSFPDFGRSVRLVKDVQ